MENRNRNYLDERRNRIIMLIIIGILSTGVILMLYSVPSALRSNAPTVQGGEGDDVLTGSQGADRFVCGEGEDTIIDYDESKGDSKTEDCENY